MRGSVPRSRSQPRVSRLLKRAVAEGVVRTVVTAPEGTYTVLEEAVEERYGLAECIVVDSGEGEAEVGASLASAAATYLETTLTGGDVIGLSSWSATWLAAVEQLAAFRVPVASQVVQLFGGVGHPKVQVKATRLIDLLARDTGAEAVFLPSPAILGSSSAAEQLADDPAVQRVMELLPQVTIALVGIGSLEPSPLLRESGNMTTAQDTDELGAAGAVGDVCLRFFDAEGHVVHSDYDRRLVGADADQIRAIPRRVAAAGQADRARIGTVDSWIVARLTGQDSYVIEAGNASRTLLLDLATLDWSEQMCDLFGVDRSVLPRVLASNADFGRTRGLDLLPDGVPIVGVLGDSHAARFGHGCRSPQEGKATYGTGSSVMVPSGADRSVRPGVSTTLAWLTEEPMYGHEGNIVASGTAMDWTARLLGVAPGRELDELAATVPDSGGGVTLVPAFTGLGAPWWDRQAVGLVSGVTAGTERGHVARAALEAVTHQIADVLEALGSEDLEVLHADGGATASRLLMQCQADLLGRSVVVSSNAEVSALGALIGHTPSRWQQPRRTAG